MTDNIKDNEYMTEIITLVDDSGEAHDFEVLDAIETDDGRYCALLPFSDDEPDQEVSEYYILQVVEVDGAEEFAEIEDEELLDSLAEIFESRFSEMFPEE